VKNQILYGLDERTYRQDPAISQSALKPILISPAHFKAGVEGEKEETSAMVLGRIAGQLVLEPDRESWWTVKPEKVSLTTTEGKDWAKEVTKWDESKDGKFPRSANDAFDAKGITVVSYDDFKRASEMAGVLADSKKPEVRKLLDNSKFEVSGFAEVETPNGVVRCKFRPDIVPNKLPVLADLKTARDARREPFLRNSVMRLSYHVQAASYLALWNLLNPDDHRHKFQFIAIESTAPYATQVHELDSEFIQRGLRDYEQMLATYALCTKLNEWPDYAPGISTLSMPKWAEERIE